MSPVANSESNTPNDGGATQAKAQAVQKVFNPFYSPPPQDDGVKDYKYAHFKVPSFTQFDQFCC